MAGFVYAQTLSALIELDLLRRLRRAPATTEALAGELALSERSVAVLMEASAALGLVERRSTGWGLGLKGAAVLGRAGVAEMVTHHEHLYADLADPLRLLREEGPTQLASFWTYAGGERGAVAGAGGYTALMAASQGFIGDAVLHARPFRRARRMVDLGGGAGGFAIAALRRHRKLTATVVDRADVIPFATDAFVAAGLSHRGDAVALDMFGDAIPGDPDLLTLIRVVHDHDDDRVAALFRHLASAVPRATLIIAEPMADPSRPSGLDAYFPWYFKAMGQGRLRTAEAIAALLHASGYASVRRLRSRNPILAKILRASVEPD